MAIFNVWLPLLLGSYHELNFAWTPLARGSFGGSSLDFVKIWQDTEN